jgi:uncharacterized phage-associated protein
VAEVIAWRIGPVLRELLAEAKIRGAMKAGDEPVDHRLCYKIET